MFFGFDYLFFRLLVFFGLPIFNLIRRTVLSSEAPFHGRGCREGLCPPGQRLERDTAVEQISPKYPRWDACIPCEAGRYKNHTGNEVRAYFFC